MNNKFPGGVWPTMVTPFNKENEVDYQALEELIEWYIKNGASGLFAVCQSSEIFYLSLEERVKVAEFVVRKVNKRIPVIGSGHISDTIEDQISEINAMISTGIDAMIFIANRLAKENESDEIWLNNLKIIMDSIPEDIPLGFYECPYPYKRLLSQDNFKWCVNNGRFYFLKDTCCDIEQIKMKIDIIKNSNLKLYNANTATLLESLKYGASGYSGVMANFQLNLYNWLCNNYKSYLSENLSDILTMTALIERQLYPTNAKYYLRLEGINITTNCRAKNNNDFSNTYATEVQMLHRINTRLSSQYINGM